MEGFSAIPVFVTVIEAGGFSQAAKKLNISKSAVSKRITHLEEQLGVKLLHRTTRKLSLTEAGEHFFQHALVAHQAAKDAEDAVAQLQGEPQGKLRINTPMSFGRLHLAPLIPEFLKRYPKISIELVLDDKMSDLVADGFDIAIRGGNLLNSTLVARKLADIKNVLCASPDYLKHHSPPKTLNDLTEHNCLVFTYSNDVKEWSFEIDGTLHTVEISGNYQVNNSEALQEAVIQGLGIARLPTFVCGPLLKSGQLVPLLERYKMPNKSFYAVFPERQYLPTKVRAFIDFSVEYFGEEVPYWDA